MQYAKVFQALGDTNRLMLLERLTDGTPYTLTTLTEGLHMTRQGARKHVQVLEEAGLITLKTNGRSTTLTVDKKTLAESRDFLERMEVAWSKRLQALKKHIENN